jgi:signal transduction histidine kinase
MSDKMNSSRQQSLLAASEEDPEKKEEEPVDSEVSEVLEQVRSSCTIAVDILNDLLLYEKFDDGMFALSFEERKIKEYFLETVNVYTIQAKGAEIDFDIVFPRSSPTSLSLENVIVKIDSVKFSQVLRNLLSNALKFTSKGGKVKAICSVIPNNSKSSTAATSQPKIYYAQTPIGMKHHFESLVHSSHDVPDNSARDDDGIRTPKPNNNRCGGFIRLAISDDGIGITKENQKKMFHEFIQFDSGKIQRGGGSGLGLWIASSIVHLHHGKIRVYSEGEGKGTTFIVDLPIFKFFLMMILLVNEQVT